MNTKKPYDGEKIVIFAADYTMNTANGALF